MTPKVALFRAHQDARSSAARLRRLGLSVACLPVIEIKPCVAKPNRRRYDAVVATSDKAFIGEAACDTSPLYVVGARTGAAAQARGWRLAAPPGRDAAQLIDMLRDRLKKGGSVLYLAGRDRKDAIEAALNDNFALEVVETYTADARKAWRPAEVRALKFCNWALHYSRRSAALATDLAKAAGVVARFLELQHICLSGDVAAPLSDAGAIYVAIAQEPDEVGLFHTLSRELAGFPSPRASLI